MKYTLTVVVEGDVEDPDVDPEFSDARGFGRYLRGEVDYRAGNECPDGLTVTVTAVVKP